MKWANGCWAFDGRANMYTSNVKAIPGDLLEKEVVTTLAGEKRPLKFAIKVERVAILPTAALKEYLKGKCDSGLAPHHILQALDVILKHRMGVNALVLPDILAQGRSFLFYTAETARQNIGGGAQIWMGYQQSVRPCQTGLALTVDTAAGAVVDAGQPSQPRNLTQLMYEILGGQHKVRPQGLDGRQVRMLESSLRGLKVQATHNGFKRTIVGVARDTPFTSKFPDSEGRETTVANYFQKQYNVRLNDRRLPCVKIGNGKVLLPPEVCTVLPKQRLDKLTGDQTAGMIKFAAQKPQDKIRFIQSKVQDVQREAQSEMKTFGVSVGGKMADIQGRVLPNPSLSYGGGKGAFNPGGTGSWNLKELKFLEGTRLDSWAVVSFANRRWEVEDVPNFIREFSKVCKSCGLSVADNPPLITPNPNSPAGPVMERAMQQAQQKFRKPADLILVILPDTGADLYREVKQAGDSHLGVPTQCVVAQKAKIGSKPEYKRGQVQYIANVALKVNAKLGGRNVMLSPSTMNTAPDFLKQFGKAPYMIMSADVTHPLAGSTMPSLAAVVASVEASATKFACRLSCQPGTVSRQIEEIITDLKNIAKDLLLEFYRATNGKRPERIFFYRDGVSEGQFDQVVAYEYEALRAACAEMGDPGSNYAPPITFIVVQKRHQTRFFATNPSQADRSGNVLAGTCVDTTICHPFEFDFYLNSHSGLQGTNRPVHYHVLVSRKDKFYFFRPESFFSKFSNFFPSFFPSFFLCAD
jgi:eukaryotic translation initiation factor 2C